MVLDRDPTMIMDSIKKGFSHNLIMIEVITYYIVWIPGLE
jgi:hypothetical protein